MPALDANVQGIVAVLNRLPGITTFSSCGGHEAYEAGQVPKGEFYVNFDVEPMEGGWSSLRHIAWAVGYRIVTTRLTVWHNGISDYNQEGHPEPPTGPLSFEIAGKTEDLPEIVEALAVPVVSYV